MGYRCKVVSHHLTIAILFPLHVLNVLTARRRPTRGKEPPDTRSQLRQVIDASEVAHRDDDNDVLPHVI